MTASHTIRTHRTPGNHGVEKMIKPAPTYTCICGKKYNHRNSLWYHVKRCDLAKIAKKDSDYTSEKINRVLPVSHTFTSGSDDTIECLKTMLTSQAETHATQMANQSETHATQLATLIQTQTAQSDAHAAAQAEQTRLLVESISLSGPPQSITNNTTNNQFNLNVFLNEDCKDAYTLKEVVDSIECTVMDLDRMDTDGYAATITRKILESMQNMSITERPIHCTDARRNAVCVKNETGWDRNETALKSLNDSVFIVGRKLSNAVPAWREAYPDHYRGTVSRRNQYHRLITNILKVSDLKVEAKITGVVCKGIVLDRKTAML